MDLPGQACPQLAWVGLVTLLLLRPQWRWYWRVVQEGLNLDNLLREWILVVPTPVQEEWALTKVVWEPQVCLPQECQEVHPLVSLEGPWEPHR